MFSHPPRVVCCFPDSGHLPESLVSWRLREVHFSVDLIHLCIWPEICASHLVSAAGMAPSAPITTGITVISLPRVFPAWSSRVGICQSFPSPCLWCFHPLERLCLLWSQSFLGGHWISIHEKSNQVESYQWQQEESKSQVVWSLATTHQVKSSHNPIKIHLWKNYE